MLKSKYIEYNKNFFIKSMIYNCRLTGELGTIIASPSKKNPNYYYVWTRDSAIVIMMIMDLLNAKYIKYDDVKDIIYGYINNNIRFQYECKYNNSQYNNLITLGEPKMYPNCKIYDEQWGRPQNDGPALRSIALIKITNYYLDNSIDLELIDKFIYSDNPDNHTLLYHDIEYTCNKYNDMCFDIWEEICGMHFYTLMVQKKSLSMFIDLLYKISVNNGSMKKLHDKINNLTKSIRSINCIIDKFYCNGRIISSSIINNWNNCKERKYDISVLLAYLHTDTKFDANLLNTISDIVVFFRNAYSINRKTSDINPHKILIGRYFDDRYYNGNPWVLTTAALATFLINIDLNKIDINSIDPSVYVTFNINKSNNPNVNTKILNDLGRCITQTIINIEIANTLSNNNRHSFSEQIDRENYRYVSANSLTWNFVEILRNFM